MSTEPKAPPSNDDAARQGEASRLPPYIFEDRFEIHHRHTKMRVAMVLARQWDELRPIIAKQITDQDLANAYMLLLHVGMRLELGSKWDRERLRLALDTIVGRPTGDVERYARYVHDVRDCAKRLQNGLPFMSEDEILEHAHGILVQWHDPAFLRLSLKTLGATLRNADLSNPGGPSADGAPMTAAWLAVEVGAFGADKLTGDAKKKAQTLAKRFRSAASEHPDTPEGRKRPRRKR